MRRRDRGLMWRRDAAVPVLPQAGDAVRVVGMTVPNAPSYETVKHAKDGLRMLPGVASVSIRPAGEHEYGTRRLVSIVVPEAYDRAPPRVLACLVEHDLGVVDVSPQGDRLIVAAV